MSTNTAGNKQGDVKLWQSPSQDTSLMNPGSEGGDDGNQETFDGNAECDLACLMEIIAKKRGEVG